ncbi:uncharacterized protein L969DRAFT_161862 [Mixia osmundae IAM 14324]|uniref:Heparinase II N-terminal domain-containing protein n=1 Tax=Mixia osmundae (strain CBS 9802 / IAM 14324 / JCM 22182 / KY 12970) TaxID=764103 RepID=G7DZA6_MIXOS|nr:uncharacterized protein L969DRAFT_161862 [Mixia osmundae IAM 14324]KEI42618.1 hypothetical protein L969DRAFT_161862 [Mixia osmundae IAM 14324]GAA95916.1 hypothetical protein E5Q_02574 [Mixia osmundae IAM 14324]
MAGYGYPQSARWPQDRRTASQTGLIDAHSSEKEYIPQTTRGFYDQPGQYSSGSVLPPRGSPMEKYGAGYMSPQSSSGVTRYGPARPGTRQKKRIWSSPWCKFGLPLLVVAIIVAAALAGYFASRASSDEHKSSTVKNSAANAPTATNSNGQPVYPSSTATPVAPSFSSDSSLACSDDDFTPTSGGATYQVREAQPRLFATTGKWSCVQRLSATDPYLSSWNQTIFANATAFAAMTPTNYSIDGGLDGSGVLDVAREVQLRMKHWGYAYRMSNDSSWATRAWEEILVASGNSTSQYFGITGDNWNTQHFLDVGEFTAAFAYAYDWFYDAWTEDQRTAIMWSILSLGISKGITAHGTNPAWWTTTNGNWNCVCNGGLILGALAILNEDPTGQAQQLLAAAIPNAQDNCLQAVQDDGTWSETSDYWYFGTNGHAQMTAGLISATGSDQGMLSMNANYNNTGLFHMYGSGFVEKFNYGDCGPNKYTATANGMMLYGNHYDIPTYALYQRDRSDAAEPLAMFYYNAQATGDWFYNLALDHYFPGSGHAWTSMRSSWTDTNGLYVAMKAGNATGHQTHGNLDAGDFVLEALGQRWFGELCQDNYLEPGYFSSEAQTSLRWLYYRCRTEGQNTLLLGGENQLADEAPDTSFASTGEAQTALAFTLPTTSTAYFAADLTSTYGGSSVKRAMRLINGRQQVLIQDEVTTTGTVQWRAHTNATISISSDGKTASLSLDGQTLQAIIQSPDAAQWSTVQPVRLASDPALPAGGDDLPNPGVTVLAINLPAGTYTIETVFNPQWPGVSSYSTPPSVDISQWSLTSHN